MTTPLQTALAAAVAAMAGGCQLIADFDPERVAETTAAMCSDGEDNDANGLIDCQDWQCLDTAACCTRATLVLEERFESYPCSARSCADAAQDPSCAAASLLDPAVWEPWGSPDPIICEGGLTPNKQEQCYPVGARARAPLQLRPGLGVEAAIGGSLEPSAYAIVGLTFQDHVLGDEVPCVSIDPMNTALSIRLEPAGSRLRATAVFQDRTVGSRELAASSQHTLRIEIGDDGTVIFSADDSEIGRSPGVVLQVAQPVYPVLYGLGSSWHFDHIVVAESNRCDAPDAWIGSPRLELTPTADGFDNYEVRAPDVQQADDGLLAMYYVGCSLVGRPECNRSTLAIGRAVSGNLSSSFDRDPSPFLSFEGNLTLYDGNDMHFEVDPDGNAFLSATQKILAASLDGPAPLGDVIVPRGPPGSWDSGEFCCSTAIKMGDVEYLWYAARAADDPTWRIGLATSTGGRPFEKSPLNPLLVEGELDAHDGRGVSGPEVLYDAERGMYRMWYVADSFLGQSSIAYAVSTDGVTWHKYPDNPLLTSEQIGLESIGGPSVLPIAGHYRLYFHARNPDWYNLQIYSIDNIGRPLAE